MSPIAIRLRIPSKTFADWKLAIQWVVLLPMMCLCIIVDVLVSSWNIAGADETSRSDLSWELRIVSCDVCVQSWREITVEMHYPRCGTKVESRIDGPRIWSFYYARVQDAGYRAQAMYGKVPSSKRIPFQSNNQRLIGSFYWKAGQSSKPNKLTPMYWPDVFIICLEIWIRFEWI